MEGLTSPPLPQSPDCSPELLARALRHEMGDFLQKVYAVVAILTDRLTGDWDQERALLASLRSRAEQCRTMLDNVQDYLCPMACEDGTVDLQAVTSEAIDALRNRFPQVTIDQAPSSVAMVQGDADYLGKLLTIFLTNACEAAQSRVKIQITKDDARRRVVWTVVDDGPGWEPRIASQPFTPFSSTRAGHVGLGLAVARRILDRLDGDIAIGNQPGGGAQARVSLPSVRPAGVSSSARQRPNKRARHDTC